MKSMEEKGRINLPFVDMSSPDIASTANSIRQACTEYGFFYLINHGIDDELLRQVFDESRKFFELPLEEKMKLERNDGHRGYTPPFAETLDTSPGYRGDLKESFYIGPMGVENSSSDSLNQWPSEEGFPFWRETMVTYYEKILTVGRRLAALIALSLKVDEDFFDKVGALQPPMAFLRLLHYPILGTDQLTSSDNVLYGASAHSDYGMVTLLITDGVPGLQICREKDTHAQIWEDVQHVDGYKIDTPYGETPGLMKPFCNKSSSLQYGSFSCASAILNRGIKIRQFSDSKSVTNLISRLQGNLRRSRENTLGNHEILLTPQISDSSPDLLITCAGNT